ncbi:mitochondrial ribosomal protein [Tothia fuscella]|uniref:Small ribosomal subunit protein mS23 n=1 Tax=Tothia fuscella TaxID=1048955 RepID=A0A9P4TZB4_9PEZI|nr:mitochondrial ribosomal protein [Tothia fuscella]
MGRYDFRPHRVLRTADLLLETSRITARPPWYTIIQDIPPSAQLTRPVFRDSSLKSNQKAAKRGKKASKAFCPLPLKYEEDKLREEFFGDHPWELARPKVLNEDGGDEWRGWDWGRGIRQLGKRLDGESVIQRQLHLMHHENHTKSHAYDVARKEYYHYRHFEAVEQQVAKEEALAYGAYFGKGPNEISMGLEDRQFEDWKEWAIKQTEREKQIAGAAYSGNVEEELERDETLDPVFEVVGGETAAPTVRP